MMIEVFQNMNVFLTENHRATLFRRQPNSPVVIVQGTEQTNKKHTDLTVSCLWL